MGGHYGFLMLDSDLTRTKRETPNRGGATEPHPLPGPIETKFMVSVGGPQHSRAMKNELALPI